MIQRIAILLMLFFLLAACSSMKTPDDDKAEKKLNAAKINTQLGIAYLEKKDVHRAKQKFLLALDEAPNLPEAWYSMGFFLESTGDKEKAKDYYLKAIKLAPNRGDTQNNYGTFLCRSGDYQGAIQYFLLAVKDPDYLETASAYENAGLCAMKIPNKALAIKYFSMALEQDHDRYVSLQELQKIRKSINEKALRG